MNLLINFPKVDVHQDNYRKHIFSKSGYQVDEDGKRIIPQTGNSKNFYLFGGSVTFGYGLENNQTYAYHLQKMLPDVQVHNYSKISNDITNLYYMILSANPVDSFVLIDTGVYEQFVEGYFPDPSIYNVNFPDNYFMYVLSKIIKFLQKRNNKVYIYNFRESVKLPINRYFYTEKLEGDGTSKPHPSPEGAIQLANQLFDWIQKGLPPDYSRFLLSDDEVDSKRFDFILGRNSDLNYNILKKSMEYRRYLGLLQVYRKSKTKNGLIYLAANPLTLGHEYLIQKALETVDVLYLGSNDSPKLSLSFDLRKQFLETIEKKYSENGKKVIFFPVSKLKNSLVTFAPYLDKNLFKNKEYSFINEHNLTFDVMNVLKCLYRFFGTEPQDPITQNYLNEFIYLEKDKSIKSIIFPRLELNGQVVSSSYCRKLIKEKDFENLKYFVSKEIFEILKNYYKSDII